MKSFLISRWLTVALAIVLFCATGCTKRAKAERHLKRANAYLAADQYDRAEIEYINVLRLQPTNTLAIKNLADIYYANESFSRAAGFLNAVKQRDPNDVESRGKLARLFISAGSLKEARAEVDAVLQISPTNENALLVLAESTSSPAEAKTNQQRLASLQQKIGDRAIFHVARGVVARKVNDLNGAESEFKSAVALEPKSPIPNLFLGGFYAEHGSNALAEPFLKNAADLSPIRSQNRIRYATFKAQTSGLDSAKPIISEVTTKAPDYIPGWLFSARLAFSSTNYTQCAADLKRVLDHDPTNFEGLLMRSDVELAQDKPEEALKTREKVCTAYPTSAFAQYQLARAAQRVQDHTRASLALNQAVTLDPLLTPAVLALAELKIRKGDYNAAIDALSRLIKAHPQVENAYMLLGTAHLSAGRFGDAIAAYNDVLKKFPNNVEAPHLIAVALRQQGRLDEARNLVERILARNPDDWTATLEMITLDVRATNLVAVEKRLKTWMEKAPQNPDPVLEMAKLRYIQKDLKGAEALAEKAISLNKDAVEAYTLLGRIYFDTNQLDSALEKIKISHAKNTNDIGILLFEGIIYENKKDYKNARDSYETVLKINPQQPVALNNLAIVYSEHLNDLDKAYPLARKAQELIPSSPAIADTLGWILSLRGEYEPALTLLRDAARQQPNEPEIVAHLGISQYLAGEEHGARTSLQNALQLSKSFNRRDQAEKYLSFLNITKGNADPATVALLEKRLSEAPSDPVALARLSAVYETQGKLNKAIAIYEKALAANPKLAIASARLADLNDRNHNSAKALELAKNARKLDPADPQIAQIAGRIATRSSDDLKDQQWGLSLLQESKQKTPADPTLAYDLAWGYLTQGRTTEAETSMKAAVSSGANHPFAADAKRFLEFLPLTDPVRAAQAQPQIDQALQADANYLPALAARCAAAQQKGDAATAVKTADQILARYPGFVPAMRNYVVFSAGQLGDTAKVWAVASRARETFRDDPEFARAFGILQYQRGEFQAATRSLSDVAKKRPNDEIVQYYLGMAHYKLNQPKETKVALSKAIDLQPKAAFAAEVQKILTELK